MTSCSTDHGDGLQVSWYALARDKFRAEIQDTQDKIRSFGSAQPSSGDVSLARVVDQMKSAVSIPSRPTETNPIAATPQPLPALDEHLAQIVFAVSSIVAMFEVSIPANSSSRTTASAAPLIRDLSQQMGLLCESQGMGQTMETRRQVAKSCFLIAVATRNLSKL